MRRWLSSTRSELLSVGCFSFNQIFRIDRQLAHELAGVRHFGINNAAIFGDQKPDRLSVALAITINIHKARQSEVFNTTRLPCGREQEIAPQERDS